MHVQAEASADDSERGMMDTERWLLLTFLIAGRVDELGRGRARGHGGAS